MYRSWEGDGRRTSYISGSEIEGQYYQQRHQPRGTGYVGDNGWVTSPNYPETQGIIVFAVITVLVTTCLGLRFWLQHRSNHLINVENGFLLLAALFFYGAEIIGVLTILTGIGYRTPDTIPNQAYINYGKLYFVFDFTGPHVGFCVKTSISLFYLRIFGAWSIKKYVYTIIGVSFLSIIFSWLYILIMCRPVSLLWDPAGVCQYNDLAMKLWYTSSALSIITELSLFCLPFTQIFKLQITTGQRWRLVPLFGLGLICIASELGTLIANVLYFTKGISMTIFFNIWFLIWPALPIIVACALTFKPLVDSLVNVTQKVFGSPRFGSSDQSPQSGSLRATIATIGNTSGRGLNEREKKKGNLKDSDTYILMETQHEPEGFEATSSEDLHKNTSHATGSRDTSK